ncbi:aldo-keto reductase, partial [Cystoisospora suis]
FDSWWPTSCFLVLISHCWDNISTTTRGQGKKEDLAADVFSPSSSARVVASASSFPFQEGSFSSSPRPSLSSSASFSTSPASSRRLYSPKHFLRADTYSPSMFKRRGLRRSHSPPSMGPVSSSELHPRKLSSPSHTRLLDTAFLSSTSDPSAPSSLQEETAHKPSSSRPSSIRGFFGSLGYDGVPASYPTARSPVFYSSLSSPKCFFSSRLFSSASRPLFSSSLSLSSPLSGRTSNFPQKGRRSSLSSVFRNPPSKREAFVFSIRHGLHMIKYSKGKNAVTSPGYMKPWSSHFFLSPPHASSSLSFPQIFRSPFSVSVKGFQLPTKISGTTNLSLLRSKVVPAAHRSQKDRRHLCLSGTQGNRWKEPLEKKKESSPFMSSSFKLTRGEERDYPRHHHGHSRLSSSSSESSSDTSSLSSLSLAQAEVMARDIVEVQAARSAVAASESEVSRPSSLYHSTEHVKKRVLGPCSTAVPVPVRREMEQEERETFLMGEDDERQEEEEVRKGQGKENNEWPGEPMKPEGETTRKCEDVFEEEEEDIQQSLTMSSTSPSKTDEKSSEEHEEKKKTKGVKKGKGKKEEKWEALAESDWHLYPRESFFNEDGTMNYERAPDTMPFMTTSAKLRLLASRQREVYKTRRATDRRPGARSWRDYLSWLPPDNPDDWKGFPPPPNKRLEDLPVKTIIVDNETILYRQACDEAPMFIDDETFERLKSKWNDTEELARVQREEKHLYDIAESFPDDCWVPIKPNLPMGRLVTDYGLIPNITLTAPGYDYIETYHDPSRNYTWSYKRWNPLKQEGEPPRDMENETKSIFELDSDISRRYWREEPRPPEKLPDDGVFRQVTLAEEMTRGMKRTPIGSDQWHYTPTNPLGQMAQPQNFWLTALNRTLDQARVQAREENLRAKTATEIYLRAVMEGRRSELEAVPDAIPLWSIPSGSSAPEDGDGNAHKNREEKSTRTENEDSDGGDRMQQGASQHNMPGPSLVQEKSKKRRNARLDVKAGPTKETSSSCCAEFSLSSPLPAKGSPASKFEAARVPSVRRSAYQPLTEVDIEAGEACDEMKYRQLGRSDLFVSEVGLGTMTVGSPQLGRDRAMSLFDYAIDHWGVNFIDTAELYPLPALPVTYGRSEEIIGDWLMKRGRRKREELVIATKVAGRSAQLSWLRGGAGADDGPRVHHTDRSLHTIEASQYGDLRQQWRGTCLSRKQIIQAAEGSLHRLKTDYIDLFQLHWPDRYVPSHASGDSADVLFDPQRAMDHDNAVDAVPMEEQLEAIGELLRDGKVKREGE